jgi:integrase
LQYVSQRISMFNTLQGIFPCYSFIFCYNTFMAGIYRRKHTKIVNGKRILKQSRFWYIKYRDIDGIEHRVKGYRDKLATQQLAAKLEKGITPKEQKPLIEHLKDYRQYLIDKGDTLDHAGLTHNRIKTILDGCKFLSTNIQASAIQRFLAKRRQSGLSAKSCNYYLTAIKSFFNWLVLDGRIDKNPIQYLKGQNTTAIRLRRSLEPDEIIRLLETTAVSIERYGMSGYERSLLYRFAIETGLRANEIRHLKVQDFNFDNLIVTVNAGYSKRRREDIQPLRKDTSILLKEFLKDKLPTDKAFGGSYRQLTKRTSDMIKADLLDSGIPYIDNGGYADFHSLRHTTGSLLASIGTHPKVIQSIMRHSDINLTMTRYTHTLRGQEAKAISSLELTPKLTPLTSYIGNQAPLTMGRGGFEPPTHGFSVRCSTN